MRWYRRALHCAALVMSRALFCLFLLVHHAFIPISCCAVLSPPCDHLSTCACFIPPQLPLDVALIALFDISLAQAMKLSALRVRTWVTSRLHFLIVPAAARPTIKHFPSADAVHRFQSCQKGAFDLYTRVASFLLLQCVARWQLPRKGTKSWVEKTQK